MRYCLLAVAFLACGCDKLKDYETRQNALAERVAKLEAEFAAAKQATPAASPGKSFNACVLAHLQGATSNLAVVAVKESCIRSVETSAFDAAKGALETATAGYGGVPGGLKPIKGLHVRINNVSPITITELTIAVQDKQSMHTNTYRVREFPVPLPEGVIVTGAAPDKTVSMMLPPGRHEFTVPIEETANDFFAAFAWQIVGAKGFTE